MGAVTRLFEAAAGADRLGLAVTRAGLVVVTVNKVRSLHAHHSAARRDARLTIAWEASEVDRAAPGGDLMELAVRDILERLPAAERAAVELRLEGYEVSEIAGRTGRSKRSVERSLQKARAHLDELMGASPV